MNVINKKKELLALYYKNIIDIEKQGPPGPPPRPGLEWNSQSHRWIRPDTGEAVENNKPTMTFLDERLIQRGNKYKADNLGVMHEARKLKHHGSGQVRKYANMAFKWAVRANDAQESVNTLVAKNDIGAAKKIAKEAFNARTKAKSALLAANVNADKEYSGDDYGKWRDDGTYDDRPPGSV